MKRRIRLTESDLHRIVKESIKRVLKEHDPDDPDYGQYGDYYDAQNAIRECEYGSSIPYWIDPSTKQIIKDGEENDDCIEFMIIPKFYAPDEYGFEVEDLDYSFDTYNKERDKNLCIEFGDEVCQFIDNNFDELYREIKNKSRYTIY